jgi:hypothetical protein
MMAGDRRFKIFYTAACFAVFLIVLVRCYSVPFSHDEVATFMYYVQNGDFMPFTSHPDANGHFLNSLLTWVCFKLFGSSELVLRAPCLLAYLVLCIAIYRLCLRLHSFSVRLFLTASFILCFNFISFYSLCRGYGLSMSFLLLGLVYFFANGYPARSAIVKCIVCLQLALSANLTLVPAVLILSFILLFFAVRNRIKFNLAFVLAWIINFALIALWIKYAFYLKETGALYYGGGESYWVVTFRSLISTLFFENVMLAYFIIAMFVALGVYFIYSIFKKRLLVVNSSFFLSYFVLCGLIKFFYFQKLLLGVNYPEDRTGLFFYVFFVLSLVFAADELGRAGIVASVLLSAGIVFCFIMQLNVRVHPWRIYETMPHSFFSIIKEEQQRSAEPLTIAGHRVRELFYGFQNYRSAVKTSHMTAPEALQMNCDLALAYAQDRTYYAPFYTELAADEDWGFRLLKRKTPIKRELLFSANNIDLKGSAEFYNVFEKTDTTFGTVNPLEGYFVFTCAKAPVPFNAWLVIQVDAADSTGSVFVRAPLNLLGYDFNGAQLFATKLVTGNIPLKIKRIVAYLWNIDKKELEIRVDHFDLNRLQGPGVTTISAAKL